MLLLVLWLVQLYTFASKNPATCMENMELLMTFPIIAPTIARSNDCGSEHYRRAHARDGINEMHPEVLNRRISSQESGEMEEAAERAGLRVRKKPLYNFFLEN